MKEQLISFETAKLAKEKGMTKYGWNVIENVYDLDNNELALNSSRNALLLCEEGKDFIFAHTQSLLQKWLREKHNLHISINTMFGDTVVWDVYVCNVAGESSLSEDEVEGSYEEALENGILQALKLI